MFSAPVSLVRQVNANSNLGTSVYQVLNPAANLIGKLEYIASDQLVTLSTQQARLNLSDLEEGALKGIHTIALASLDAQTLSLSSANLSSLNTEGTVKVVLDRQDRLLTDLDWR